MTADHRRGRSQLGSAPARVPLVDLEPDMFRFLAPEDRESVDQVTVPVIDVSNRSLAITELLDHHHAFAAVVYEGMLLQYLQIGAQPGMRVIGPGEIVGVRDSGGAARIGAALCRATASTRLALLGSDFLLAVKRSPRLLIGLQAGVAEQMERLTEQLVICQLPRVEDRVLAMLWLLANTWGRVTSAGTIVPLSLTHEVLGALVGARRPTVTLALSALAERGAVLHQDRGWLLLEAPIGPPVEGIKKLDALRVLDQTPSEWAAEVRPAWDSAQTLAVLSDTVSGLREQYVRNVEQVRERVRRASSSRAHATELRKRIRGERGVSRRPPPSA